MAQIKAKLKLHLMDKEKLGEAMQWMQSGLGKNAVAANKGQTTMLGP